MRLNKKHMLCFFLIMFITLICCCTISAADNADGSTATAVGNDASNIQTVEQTRTGDIQETSISTEESIQSENNIIGDKNDQNDVKDNNDNLKVIEKVKSEGSLKGAVINPGDTIPSSGTHSLGGNITVSSTITLTDDLTIDGQGYTITGRNLNDLFNAGSHKVTLTNVTITNVTGYVVSEGNYHTFTKSAFINNGGIVHMGTNQARLTLKNCLIENSTDVVFNCQHRTKTTFEICNCIFKDNKKAIIWCNNHLTIKGYNFNVINGDLDEIMNKSVAETHSKHVNPSASTAPDDCYFAYHTGLEFDSMTETFPVSLEVIPEKSQVYINETNHVIVRLSADENGEILGAQNEFVNITVLYTDGHSEDYSGKTNYLGEVYLDLKSEKKGTMTITARYDGSSYISDNSAVIYEALQDPVSGTYLVLGLPATINAEDQTGSIYKDVSIPVSVTNGTGNEVNEGTLTLKLNGVTVGTINLATDEHKFTVYSEEPDVIEYTLVYEGDVYEAPDKTVRVTFVDDRKTVTIITTDKEGYVNEEITSPFEVKSDGNDVNVGNVSVYIQNGTSYEFISTIDLSKSDAREVSKVYNAAKVYTLFYNYTDSSGTYKPNSNTSKVTVSKKTPALTITGYVVSNKSTSGPAPEDLTNFNVTFMDEDTPIGAKDITFIIERDGQVVYTLSNSTNSNGLVGFNFTPEVEGTYTFTARYVTQGDSDLYDTVTSQPVEITYNKIKTDTRTFSLTPQQSSDVKFNGTLFYYRDESNGNPEGNNITIPGASITVKVRVGDVEHGPKVITTDDNGAFLIDFPDIKEEQDPFTIVFNYSGDNRYKSNIFEKTFDPDATVAYSTFLIEKDPIKINQTNKLFYQISDVDGNGLNGSLNITNATGAEVTLYDENGAKVETVYIENGAIKGNVYYVSPEAKEVLLFAEFINKTHTYAVAKESVSFTVVKLDSNIAFTVLNNTVFNTTIEVSVVNPENSTSIVENGMVEVYNYTDAHEAGQLLGNASIVDGKVNITLNSSYVNREGTYNIYLRYGGNDYFLQNNTYGPVDVVKVPVTVTPTVTSYYTSNFVAEVTVVSDDGNIVNDGIVTLYDGSNNVVGYAEVKEGKAVIKNSSITPRTGEVFTAKFTDSDYFKDGQGVTEATDVVKYPATLTIADLDTVLVNETVVVTAKLLNGTTPVNGQSIRFIFDDGYETQISVTEDGIATATYKSETGDKTVNVTAELVNNNVYEADSVSDLFYVEKLNTETIIIAPKTVNVAEQFRFNITLTKEDETDIIPSQISNLKVTVNDEEVIVRYDDDNKVYYALYTPRDNSKLVILANFKGDAAYKPSDDDHTIDSDHINLIPTQMTITVPETAKVYEEFTYKVNLTNKTGDLIPNKVVYASVNDGDEVELTYDDIEGLYIGKYTPQNNDSIVIKAHFDGDNVYNASQAVDDTLTGDKITIINTEVSIEAPAEVTVLDDVVIKVNLTDEYGQLMDPLNVTVTVNDNPVTFTGENITDNVITLTIPTTEKTTLTVVASYPGLEGVYNKSSDTASIKVNPIDTTVKIVKDKVTVQRQNTNKVQLVTTADSAPIANKELTITVVDADNNNLLIKTSGRTDSEGYITVDFKPLTTSDIVLTAVFEGDKVFNANESNVTYSLTSDDFIFITPTIDLTATNTIVFENNTITVTLTDEDTKLSSQDVTVTVDGDSKTYTTDENGQVVITDYTFDIHREDVPVVVKYDGNTTLGYNALDNQTATFNVSRINTTISAVPTNVMAGNITFDIEVRDYKNDLVPYGDVVLSTGENEYPGVIKDGITTITITDLSKGVYDFTAVYKINDVYYNSSTDNDEDMKKSLQNIEVTGRTANITFDVINNTYKNATITVHLYDNITEEDLVGETVVVYNPDGDEIGRGVIQENGNATIKLDLPIGENQPINVTFAGNDIYDEVEVQGTIDILKRNTTTVAEVVNNVAGNVTVKVNVTDAANGEAITSGYVNITDAKTGKVVGRVELTQADNGVVDIVTSIDTIGEYDLIANYEGNDYYYNSSDLLDDVEVVGRSASISAEVVDDTLGDSSITVELKDDVTGEPIADAEVIITLPDGTEIKATTDENGVVTVPVDLPVGPNDLDITYPGDGRYDSAGTTLEVDINPRDTVTEAVVVSDVAGNVTLDVTVTDAETGDMVPNGPVEVYVDDVLVGSGEIVDGKATIVTDIADKGVYDITVKYLGTENYTASQDVLDDVEVVGKESEIIPEVVDNIVGETEISVKLIDPVTSEPLANRPVTIVLDDNTNITATTDENGMINQKVDLPAGSNNVLICFEGDDTYNSSEIELPVNVVKRNATLTPNVINNTDGTKTIEVSAADLIRGDIIKDGVIELTLPDNTKITAPLNENGTAVFDNVQLPEGVSIVNATLLENPVYNEVTTSIAIDNTPVIKVIKIGDWKLICINPTPEDDNPDDTKPADTNSYQPRPRNNVRTTPYYYGSNGKSNRYNNGYRNYRPSRNRPARNYSPRPVPMSKAQYIILITLYQEYLMGDMTFADFVAILSLNGIEIAVTSDWDSNGQIILEYDNIEDIPDSIEIHDNSGHLEDYTQNINKNNAPDSEGIMDSGDVVVKTKAPSSNSGASASTSNSGVSSGASDAVAGSE